MLNDGEGVLIRARGAEAAIAALVARLEREPPPLAQIDRVEIGDFAGALPAGFRIVESGRGAARTRIAPDAAICPACAAEALDPGERRYRYPFTNCTHCGPRLSIALGIPYDRAARRWRRSGCARPVMPNTATRPTAASMRRRPPAPTAGRVRCCAGSTAARPESSERYCGGDATLAAARLLRSGDIVAIKGLGGYQLACDATNADAVARLRRRSAATPSRWR